MLEKSRTVLLELCGVKMQVAVKDPVTEWDLRLQTFLKSQALGRKGGLEPLLHEEWLMTFDTKLDCGVPEDSMYDRYVI